MHSTHTLRPSSERRLRADTPLVEGSRGERDRSTRPPPLLPPTPPSNLGSQRFLNIAELKRKSVPELQDMAANFSIENVAGLGKQDLIFRVE